MHDKNNSVYQARGLTRRQFLGTTLWMSGAVATGLGSWVIPAKWSSAAGAIKVGIATDLTGPIGFAGNANANIASASSAATASTISSPARTASWASSSCAVGQLK